MRAIFNFVFFGLLFYGIHQYFPEVFAVMVTAVAKFFEIVRSIIITFIDAVSGPMKPASQSMLPLLPFIFWRGLVRRM